MFIDRAATARSTGTTSAGSHTPSLLFISLPPRRHHHHDNITAPSAQTPHTPRFVGWDERIRLETSPVRRSAEFL